VSLPNGSPTLLPPFSRDAAVRIRAFPFAGSIESVEICVRPMQNDTITCEFLFRTAIRQDNVCSDFNLSHRLSRKDQTPPFLLFNYSSSKTGALKRSNLSILFISHNPILVIKCYVIRSKYSDDQIFLSDCYLRQE
jgi:hypothetical protein